MRPGTRACYGASSVGVFSGLMLSAAGSIILLETAYVDGHVGHAVWMLACFMCVAGFAVLLLSLLFCSCAMCMHSKASASVYPEDDEELPRKKSGGWASPVANGGLNHVWTTTTTDESWVPPVSPIVPEVEDLEEVAILEAEEEEAELEAELAAVEAEMEAEVELEPEPDVQPEEAEEKEGEETVENEDDEAKKEDS